MIELLKVEEKKKKGGIGVAKSAKLTEEKVCNSYKLAALLKYGKRYPHFSNFEG